MWHKWQAPPHYSTPLHTAVHWSGHHSKQLLPTIDRQISFQLEKSWTLPINSLKNKLVKHTISNMCKLPAYSSNQKLQKGVTPNCSYVDVTPHTARLQPTGHANQHTVIQDPRNNIKKHFTLFGYQPCLYIICMRTNVQSKSACCTNWLHHTINHT